MNYQAGIFDMDGLLLDTGHVCMRVFQEAYKVQKLPYYEDVYLSIIGRNAAGIETIYRKAYGNELDRLHQEWRTSYNAVVMHEAIPVKDGVYAHTDVIGGGESTSVTFSTEKMTAGGDYSFFCSFPGHWAVMQGKFEFK